MTSTVRELLDVLTLEDLGGDRFRGRQVDEARIRVFGGQVVAQALMAAGYTVPEGLRAHSLHAYFLRMGDSTVDIEYAVERVRDGRSFATRRVVAIQHDRPIYAMMANFHVDEPGFEHQDPGPAAPAPEDCPPYRGAMGADVANKDWRADWGPIEMLHAGDTRKGDLLEPVHSVAEARSWVRYDEEIPDDPRLHQAVLAYMSDLTLFAAAALPHAKASLDSFQTMASLDHAVWFHRPARVDEWLLFSHRSPVAAGARGLVQASFHTRDGSLVATVTQEGVMRPHPGALDGQPDSPA